MVGKAFEFEAGGLEFHAVRLEGEDNPRDSLSRWLS